MRQKSAEMLAAFQRANPHLSFPLRSVDMPPQPEEAAVALPSRVERVLQAGGELAAKLAHPDFVPLEKLFRKLPAPGIFTATPQRNFEVQLGAFQVPAGMTFALCDYRFDLYRLSGAAAGDWVPIESRRLSGQIGYSYLISDYQPAQLDMQIEPTPDQPSHQWSDPQVAGGVIAAGAEFNMNQPPQIGSPYFPPSSPPTFPSPTDFALARGAAVASPGGPGLALLPQRTERLGSLAMPFTAIVRENQRIVFRAIVFRPVPIPLAFFECDVTGFLISTNVLDSLYAEMAPYTPQGDLRR